MNFKSFYILLATAFIFSSSCTPKVKVALTKNVERRQRLPSENFVVFEKEQPWPANALELGTVKITDTGFSLGCSYDKVIELAKRETLKSGGNALKIVAHRTPDTWSTCHRIEGSMLFLSEMPQTDNNLKISNAIAQAKHRYDSLQASNKDSAAVFLEQIPQFPGGPNAFTRFFNGNIQYPKAARKAKIKGKAVSSFVVDSTGFVTQIEIIESLGPDIDQEIIRVLKLMPRWVPGFVNGRPVNVKYTMPVDFGISRGFKNW